MTRHEVTQSDRRKNHLIIPEEGETPLNFTYSFFPKPQEAAMLAQATTENLRYFIENQPNLTSRFFHELIATGRTEEVQQIVDKLGGPGVVTQLVNSDCHRALTMMTQAFVPEEEIQRFIAGLHALGLQEIQADRRNSPRVNAKRLEQVLAAAPTRDDLQAYVHKYNNRQLDPSRSLPYTEGLRIIDPTRGLRYVGDGYTRDYDWLEVSQVSGFVETGHYASPDSDLMIALLKVY